MTSPQITRILVHSTSWAARQRPSALPIAVDRAIARGRALRPTDRPTFDARHGIRTHNAAPSAAAGS